MQIMIRPSDETLQKIDFVIQGLENGKYTELAKQVEFHQKLKGENDPSYFQSLINALEAAQIDIVKLEQQTMQQERTLMNAQSDLMNAEQKLRDQDTDIKTLGKAIRYLMAPDPITKNYELTEISNWLTNKAIY